MAKDFAVAFYHSQEWRRCQAEYVKQAGGLCERCKEKGIIKAGVIVHHKIQLTKDNIGDPGVCLNFSNLQLLCRNCHAEVHKGKKRYKVDEFGRITAIS